MPGGDTKLHFPKAPLPETQETPEPRDSCGAREGRNTLPDSSSGGSLIVAAIVLALSVVTASFILKGALDNGATQLAAVVGEMKELGARVAAAPTPAARPARPARPGRPDPSKKYEVPVGAAPTRGPDAAAVTIIEWSDFECPFCRRAGPTLAQVEKEYGDKVQIAFKHLPLSMHRRARAAHAAAEAAHMQGKFWEMHDLIFSDQRGMSEEKYEEYAEQLEMDVDKFNKDRKSPQVEARISSDVAQASKLGITGTPAFLVNGRYLSGAQPFARFKTLIDETL